MNAIAPNLTYMVGELVGARLISQAGPGAPEDGLNTRILRRNMVGSIWNMVGSIWNMVGSIWSMVGAGYAIQYRNPTLIFLEALCLWICLFVG